MEKRRRAFHSMSSLHWCSKLRTRSFKTILTQHSNSSSSRTICHPPLKRMDSYNSSSSGLYWPVVVEIREWSPLPQTLRCLISWDSWRSTVGNVRRRVTMLRPGKHPPSLRSSLKRKSRGRGTTSVQHKSTSLPTLRLPRRPSSWSFLRLGTTIWVTMRPLLIFRWRSLRRNTC